MTANRQTPPSLEPAESIALIEVSDSGTLRMANYARAETRAEFYDYIFSFWSHSPKDLANAMDDCEPLAWVVHEIYSEFRDELAAELEDAEDELAAELEDAEDAGTGHKRKVAALKARLEALPEEPWEGAADWLLGLASKEFEARVVPVIEKWFGEAPDWSSEFDYLPESATAQGAALEFFRGMADEDLEILGIDVVEGDHPGSTYYAAELRYDIDAANRAAEVAGILVRFVLAND